MSLNLASVFVREEGILVSTGGFTSVTKGFTDAGEAALYLALDIWREREFWPSRNSFDPPFDWQAFDALVEAECDVLQATNGWRQHATAGDYTIWALAGMEFGSSEVTDLAFQATKGEVPSSDGGYRRLESLLRAKNVFPHEVTPVKADARDVRAVAVGGGGDAWHGFHREGAAWVQAQDADGRAAVYPDPESARTGAFANLERSREPEDAPRP